MLVPILQQNQQIVSAAPPPPPPGGGFVQFGNRIVYGNRAARQDGTGVHKKQALHAQQVREDDEIIMLIGAAITNRRLH